MVHVFTAKGAKLLELNTLRMLFFVLRAVVIDTVALSALKMNCLAHVFIPLCLRSPAFGGAGPTYFTESLEDFR